MLYHELPCNTLHPVPGNRMDYLVVPLTILHYHALPNVFLHHWALLCSSINYHTLPHTTLLSLPLFTTLLLITFHYHWLQRTTALSSIITYYLAKHYLAFHCTTMDRRLLNATLVYHKLQPSILHTRDWRLQLNTCGSALHYHKLIPTILHYHGLPPTVWHYLGLPPTILHYHGLPPTTLHKHGLLLACIYLY